MEFRRANLGYRVNTGFRLANLGLRQANLVPILAKSGLKMHNLGFKGPSLKAKGPVRAQNGQLEAPTGLFGAEPVAQRQWSAVPLTSLVIDFLFVGFYFLCSSRALGNWVDFQS